MERRLRQGRFRLSVGTLFALCLFTLLARAEPLAPTSVGFWYGDRPPLPELAQFDWLVVEPEHFDRDDVTYIRAQGSQPFAYLSVGELDPHDAQRNPSLREFASPTRNAAWDSQVMDLTTTGWRNHLMAEAGNFYEQGYSGLFLDTLDSFTLLPEAERKAQRDALVELLLDMKKRFPHLRLIFNRGFEVMDEVGDTVAAVAAESIYQGWDAGTKRFRKVPRADRDWLVDQLEPLRKRGIPIIAIDYLPPHRRTEARKLAKRLHAEGYIPFVTTPELDYLGISTLEVQPRRIAMLYDPSEGTLDQSSGHHLLGGLLEYLGYRVDYLPVDGTLPMKRGVGFYAGIVVWMTSGVPLQSENFYGWLTARLDEKVPLVFMAGLPVEDAALLRHLGLRRSSDTVQTGAEIIEHDAGLLGQFEAPLSPRTRGLLPVSVRGDQLRTALLIRDGAGKEYSPLVVADWGGMALAPYVLEEGGETRRWILDPFAFLQQTLRLPPIPAPDVSTENGRRIATVHIDGDGFPSRAEIPGTPFAGQQVLDAFIKPYPLLTSVSIVEGEVSPAGAFPELADELEPIARKIFAEDRVEVASHSFSHPFFWQPEVASKREGFNPEYGFHMEIPGYEKLDFRREIIGSTRYINEQLAPAGKPVKVMFWSGDAMPDAETLRLTYEAGLLNVNGGTTKLTYAEPSLTGLSPLLRPTAGGLHVYAPIINENVYTNLWHGPYYGFRGVIETFELTDTPRRFRGLHLYYHFYSGTKQASIKVMDEIYQYMLAQQPLSLWMSDYLQRVFGLHSASLALAADGSWQIRSLQGLRTVRLDPALGWPDLMQSSGVAGVRDLPQGRYVHLSADRARLVLRSERDPAPALEEANLPLLRWDYDAENRVRFTFAGALPLSFSVRSDRPCKVSVGGTRQAGRQEQGLWHFDFDTSEVRDALLLCD
ncbi:PbsX family transcriptional regulator [Pseudomonas sp. gcc21]|uniref:bifunctional glycoside hydrolase 114/ polysaccharide deacetylase family protein n=1 Tax=Pseudomonas sp. gcc21 TaxID=2726989 RepID=UPI0014523B22|nr:bifunctional glycoside hydrolase 114/ polysaccharide deacetylase family protein [Pseudomonas sp. gcc21]QJD57894.1 PbsX family transcriptional regulator [Pseudomonas sp. gcc21]